MKRATVVLLMGFVLMAFAGAALAEEMSGAVTAVDAAKGTLSLKYRYRGGSVSSDFDCEASSLIKDVKVGQHVTVVYTEAGGKKTVTKVTQMKRKITSGWE